MSSHSPANIYAAWYPQGKRKLSALWLWCRKIGEPSDLEAYVTWLNTTLCYDPRPGSSPIPCEFFLVEPQEEDNPFIPAPGQHAEPYEASSLWDESAQTLIRLAQAAIQDDLELYSNDSSEFDGSSGYAALSSDDLELYLNDSSESDEEHPF